MGESVPHMDLPDAKCKTLHLSNPTPEERQATWRLNGVNWGTALKGDEYLEREAHLMNVPLARDGGITHWILVDAAKSPNERPILASCESLRKRVLVAKDGVVTEGITHGIGSVFCDPKYRGRGYASRMMTEVGSILKNWQTHRDNGECTVPFSILYSDIGQKYYAKHGWHVYPSSHVALLPAGLPEPVASTTISQTPVQRLEVADLAPLCAADELLIKKQLSGLEENRVGVALLPDHDTMQWHHSREDFVTSKIFGKLPSSRGAIAGIPGARVWAIWTRSFYGPLRPESGNALHILRLVLEDQAATIANAQSLKAVLQIAQAEAAEWKLDHVEFWNPTLVVKELMKNTDLKYEEVDREEESICSLMWYGEGRGTPDEITWLANEKFGWC